MLLKSLELQGFKSFPDKTRLEFHDGVTAVVGPNGSGKSNISDAVRWVLGEQSSKTLRGAKMEDVIFLGTQSRKSQGFAQVSLTFDNSSKLLSWDSNEVTVTRKYYRSGDSEYLINGAQVRLKEISELFMDTGLGRDGYSIVGQGKIDEIVSAKSDDRRQIFEEAAGITKFRHRKQESERRLKLAEENLVRLRDILGELETRVGPLKEQSEKAKQFIELAERKKQLEISLWTDALAVSRQNLREQDDRVLVVQQSHDAVQQDITQIEYEIQQAYQAMQNSQMKIESIRAEKEQNDRTSAEHHSLIAVLNNDITHNLSDIQRIISELDSYQLSGDQMTQDKLVKQKELEQLSAELEQLEQKISQSEQELLVLSDQRTNVSTNFEQLNQNLNRFVLERSKAKMNLLSMGNNLTDTKHRLEQLGQIKQQRKNEQQSAQDELQEVNRLVHEIQSRKESLTNTRTGHSLKLNTRKTKLEELTAQFNRLNALINEKEQKSKILTDLENNLEGFAYSVKAVMTESKRGMLSGVRGTVAQLITLPTQYAIAVETALGGSLQNIVVDNETVAKKAIHLLKEHKAGRATFLPLTSIKGNRVSQPGLEKCDGYIGIACDLVKFDEEYHAIITSLLGKTVVVEDLDCAVAISKQYGYRFKIVTLDGQVVNAGGSLTGGSQNRNSGLLGRKNEIKQLISEAEQLSSKRTAHIEATTHLNEQISKVKAELQAVDGELIVLNEDNIRFEGEQKRLEQLVRQSEQGIIDLAQEHKTAQTKVDQFTQQISATKTALQQAEIDIERSESQISGLRDTKDTLSQQRTELEQRIQSQKIEQAEKQKDRQSKELFLSELDNRNQSNRQAIASLSDTIKRHQQSNQEIQEEIEQLGSDLKRLAKRQTEIAHEIEQAQARKNQSEQTTTRLRQREREQSLAREKFGQELARLEERKLSLQKEYDAIISRMWEEYQITPSEAQNMAVGFDDPLTAQGELNSLKNQIKSLGNVNLSAIEEYKEVSERYTFMTVQLGDIEHSKNELEKLINELTSNMKELFVSKFNKINQEFKKTFVELFGGGSANLSLADPDHVLDCGIDISVQPPGKIIKNLSSLSGGEKAFIAISIYFAILQVSPSPFCILDEIEAALDDVNVNKFASYLKHIDVKTQFIIITHRRGTMEQADVLYGVTMQEEGVSKLLQLKVTELAENMKLEG